MTTFRIVRNACLKKSHKKGIGHDDIVCRIIRQMRKLGARLIEYDEDYGRPTIMKFEDR